MNFAQLFRKSVFARFNPKTPIIFSKGPPPIPLPNSPLQFEAIPRESSFGLKADPPAQQYGKSIDFVTLTALDGDFGIPKFNDAKDRVLKRKIFDYLEKLLTSSASPPRVPGRIIESCEGGFLIGIGPVRAHLPQSEIPAGINFNYYDMLDRKAYYFHLKSIQPNSNMAASKNKDNCRLGEDIFTEKMTGVGNNRKLTSFYTKYSQEQGFKVILTLRK